LLNDLDKLAFDQFDVIDLQERLIFMEWSMHLEILLSLWMLIYRTM
jgi:hypothetical protein